MTYFGWQNISLNTKEKKKKRETEGDTSFKIVMNHECRAISVIKRSANLSSFFGFFFLYAMDMVFLRYTRCYVIFKCGPYVCLC